MTHILCIFVLRELCCRARQVTRLSTCAPSPSCPTPPPQVQLAHTRDTHTHTRHTHATHARDTRTRHTRNTHTQHTHTHTHHIITELIPYCSPHVYLGTVALRHMILSMPVLIGLACSPLRPLYNLATSCFSSSHRNGLFPADPDPPYAPPPSLQSVSCYC